MISVTAGMRHMAKKAVLSPRETQVLRGVMQGRTYAAIGLELGLSRETIKVYARRIRQKLGVSNKVGMALWGAENLPRT